MNAGYNVRIMMGAAAVVLGILSLSGQTPLRAQPTYAGVVWANALYGANSSGVGICGRYGFIGGGVNVFGFAGDSSRVLPTRPGAIGITIDAYFAADVGSWLALYGNIGFAGRLRTYVTTPEIARAFDRPNGMSLGGGVQVSLASHIVLGVGYNGIIDIPDKSWMPSYTTIHTIVAQLGYRP